MEKQFWISVKENKFAFPDGYSIQALTDELLTYMGSTDPELRDTIGLEAFYHWLTQGLYSADDLRGLIKRLLANLQRGLGETENDTVFLRSFSALWLANIVSYDHKERALEKEDILSILETGLTYFAAERDARGYDPVKGWIHAFAHGADLLCALAISSHTGVSDHLKILNCIASKLGDPALPILYYNEDSRIAQPVVWICQRGTLTVRQVEAWLATVSSDWDGAWSDVGRTRAYNNGRNFLRSVYWYVLKRGDDDMPDKRMIIQLLQERIDQARPWAQPGDGNGNL